MGNPDMAQNVKDVCMRPTERSRCEATIFQQTSAGVLVAHWWHGAAFSRALFAKDEVRAEINVDDLLSRSWARPQHGGACKLRVSWYGRHSTRSVKLATPPECLSRGARCGSREVFDAGTHYLAVLVVNSAVNKYVAPSIGALL